jgi:Integrase core domain
VCSQSTCQYFKKPGIAQLFSRPRTPNDNSRIEAHFGTIKFQPVYPNYFADVPATATRFTGFNAWYNDLHPQTTLAMLTRNQVHTGQAASLLAARQTHQAEALARHRSTSHAPFTLQELIAEALPDVSQCPVYSWAGPNAIPQSTRHRLRN